MTRNRMVWPATLTVVVLVLSGCGGHQRKSPEAAAATGSMSGSFAETLPSGGAATDSAGTAGAPDAMAGTTDAAGPTAREMRRRFRQCHPRRLLQAADRGPSTAAVKATRT